MRSRTRMLIGAAIASLAASAANAQSDVVVMRRVLAPATRTPTPSPTPTSTIKPGDPGYYSWQVSAWTQTGSCGQFGTETRSVSCVRTDGTAFPDSYCTDHGSGRKPIASQSAYVTQTCGYAWSETAWSAPATSCGTSTITRDVSCIRSDQTVADPSSCAGPRPADSEAVTETSGCSFSWSVGDWGAPDPACGQGVETRSVTCMRSDGVAAPSSNCRDAAPSSTQSIVSSCGAGGPAAWTVGAWGSPVPGCGITVSQRTVTCQEPGGTVHPDTDCTGAKPATTEPSRDYSTCTDGRTADNPYGWTTSAYGPPTTMCGAATETRNVVCTDDEGGQVADSMCRSAKPSATLQVGETAGCTYAWATGGFGAPLPGCGATVATRDVHCARSDGTVVEGAYCGSQDQPPSTEGATDYSACTYGWTTSAWSDPSTTCGSATSTRSVVCQRADGTAADDGQCVAATRPAATQSSYETSGCGVEWSVGDWTPSPACGATTQTRSVTCLRSDGQTVDDAQCAPIGAKPDTSGTTTDYSTCSFSWASGEYPAPTSTCGTTTQTRSVTCLRSDGTTVADSQCNGTKPDTSETTTQTSSCTYAWSPEAWGAATPACGASTHSRTVDCMRSDQVTVAASLCSGAGAAPPTSEATTDYGTCSYKWVATDWQGTAGCGSTVTQTRNVYCQRSDGTQVADALCGDPSGKPASTQPITDYSQCSYSWHVSYGTWSSTCSSSAMRQDTVTCVRSDGQTVADQSMCDASTKPSSVDTGNYAGCTYTGTYGAPLGTCVASGSSGTQSTTLVSCRRSDGTDVTAQNASGHYSECAMASSQSCTPASTKTCSPFTNPPGPNVSTGTDVNGQNTLTGAQIGTYTGSDWKTAIPAMCQRYASNVVFCYAIASTTTYASATWTVHVLTGPAAPQPVAASTNTKYAASSCQ